MTSSTDQITTVQLIVDDLRICRGGAVVVDKVSLEVPAGEVTVLLGPNGSGKTTLLEAVSGQIPVASGEVRLGSVVSTRYSPGQYASAGVSLVAQGRAIFRGLTLEENLLVSARREELARAYDLFPELARRRTSKAELLSGGEQQMLVIARALVRSPRFLLVDEMSQGLAPTVVRRLLETIAHLAASGVGVLLVEQFASMALAVGKQAYVLNHGRIVAQGSCADLAKDKEILHVAYFGS